MTRQSGRDGFADRRDAGRDLAVRLAEMSIDDPVVLGLARGGVPVAAEVARALGAPLDVLLVRKLGVPFHSELAFGAIGEDGVRVIHADTVRRLLLDHAVVAEVEAREHAELERRVARFRAIRPAIVLTGRTAVVVDDGLATGATARAGVEVVRRRGARRVIVAVPVAAAEAVADLSRVAEVVTLLTPPGFRAVGEFYDDFDQTSDDEVASLLDAPE